MGAASRARTDRGAFLTPWLSCPAAGAQAPSVTRCQTVPLQVSVTENIEYMSTLYARCQASKEKTKAALAEKYLKPLVKPAANTPRGARKAKARGGGEGGPAAAT